MLKLNKISASLIGTLVLLPFSLPSLSVQAEELAKDAPQKAIVKQAMVEHIVQEISAQRIDAYINKLVSFGTRHTMSDTKSDTRGIGAARRWIKSELERCGANGKLNVSFDSYTEAAGRRLTQATDIVNVVAELKSVVPSDRYYVVSGHYDTRATDVMDATSVAPGANDDASGTAAVMEMACVMAQSKYKFNANLIFMAVAGEEQGLFGAAHFAKSARAKNMNIAGMFTNDIIGSSRADDGHIDNNQVRLFAEGIPALAELPEPLRTLISTGGENDSISRQLARQVKQIGETYVPDFKITIVNRRDRYLRGGDHIPFLEQGYAALRFTEPNEDFNHQHQDVRTENGIKIGDLPEFVDVNYTAQVARVNAAALATLALAPASPAQVKIQTAQLENSTSLVWQANSETDLAGYRILWRETTAANWQHSLDVGNVTSYTMKNVSKDNVFFGVQAVDKKGNASVASYPLPLR
ncbi:M28 family metallopeptidase [Undibacterium sp. RTI2.1]|uniref:M28 family metallopeptidase n=1 Tax=unclassified Undibacterium TaxID=2630295 RepID=UPI002AB570FE|nr:MULTISPECIES: M28 family metallopeptidase [unclassified Undibacterium]MDY7539771.1 M28 family metallopeptidase [Undibacterium sp. 5I1]MEB0029443.1 M28 family metallopeptidase [Undibacterium sp. RTI2.1]MEB0115938.1 M28 family metallopeptidase [Undibacterium sp. RTI2.2]MEB0232436.1 M28 family metallopeptidase [Undibacterium sp. 10I3]MEB0256806.1 M28 family metallopeptidase [Undibacterium sp. 5I1]